MVSNSNDRMRLHCHTDIGDLIALTAPVRFWGNNNSNIEHVAQRSDFNYSIYIQTITERTSSRKLNKHSFH